MGYTEVMKQQKKTTVGDILRQIRSDRKLSLRELAKILGVANSWIAAIENGGTAKPVAYYALLNKKLHLTAVEKDLVKQAIIAAFKEELDEV